jgi:hypothetical protein
MTPASLLLRHGINQSVARKSSTFELSKPAFVVLASPVSYGSAARGGGQVVRLTFRAQWQAARRSPDGGKFLPLDSAGGTQSSPSRLQLMTLVDSRLRHQPHPVVAGRITNGPSGAFGVFPTRAMGCFGLVNIYHACSEAPSISKQVKGSPKTSLYGTSRTR